MIDYKKYSLENLEHWLHDAISSGDATPQEIYDVIVKVVRENYEYHKQQADQSNQLLTLLNGFGKSQYDIPLNTDISDIFGQYQPSISLYENSGMDYLSCDKDDPSPECQNAWNDFWDKEDQVNRWVLPVQLDGLTGECYINLPDDLLERAGLKEGDMVHWIDRKDGSFEMRKVNGTK